MAGLAAQGLLYSLSLSEAIKVAVICIVSQINHCSEGSQDTTAVFGEQWEVANVLVEGYTVEAFMQGEAKLQTFLPTFEYMKELTNRIHAFHAPEFTQDELLESLAARYYAD